MKQHVFFSAALLSAGLSFAQTLPPPSGREWQIGYSREVVKTRDEQASPMLYIANLNSLRLGYTRSIRRSQVNASVQAGMGDYIAPALGIRDITFQPSEPDAFSFPLAPTLYQGHLALDYLCRFSPDNSRRVTYWGLGLREQMAYADGVALSTWALNVASLNLLYQANQTIGERHLFSVQLSLPLLSAVGRMPYSNTINDPEHSNSSAFIRQSQLATLPKFRQAQVGLSYRFAFSQRTALQAAYRFQYLRYPEPQLIRSSAHSITLSLILSHRH